jgi:hypothetical protein
MEREMKQRSKNNYIKNEERILRSITYQGAILKKQKRI